jgi:ATP-dependent RNA helicase DDX3X
MDSYEHKSAASAEASPSAANPGSDNGVADGTVHESHVQEDAPAGVLSGIGPNAEEAGQVARDKGWTEPVPFVYSELTSKEHRDWAGVAARYEWKDDYGDVGPSIPELEDQLFRSEMIPRAGIKLDE